MTTESDIIQGRDQLLARLCENVQIKHDFPLIKSTQLDKGLFDAAQRAAGEFIWSTMRASGMNPEFTDFEDLINRYGGEILRLPPVTPNGVIRPKQETSVAFNLLQQRVADIVKSLGIDDKVFKMRSPHSIRIVESNAPDWVVNRPRANNIMHSDFWTGGCCDLALLLPLFGDVINSGLKFAEPKGFDMSFLQELPEYKKGSTLYQDSLAYDLTLEKGCLFFQDIFCLHGTWRNNGGYRVSMDWTVQTDQYGPIEKRHSSKVLETDNHFSMKDWYKMGTNALYFDNETMAECQNRFENPQKVSETKLGSAISDQTAEKADIFDLSNGRNNTFSAYNLAKSNPK